MTIALSPETTRLIEQHLAAGPYRSADELVQMALVTLDHNINAADFALDEDDLDAIDEAEDQLERGEGVDVATAREMILKQLRQ